MGYSGFISACRIKSIVLAILLSLLPMLINAQWQYIKKIADSCTPTVVYNYSYETWQVGSHGGGYNVLRDGTVIKFNEGTFGCCWVRALEPFTDSIVIFVEASQGPDLCSITSDAGNNWSVIDCWMDLWIQDWNFINKNTCYYISKGIYFDGSRISIRRVSDIKSKYLLENESIDTSNSVVHLTDTIFGAPNCPNIDTIGFRILQNGILIDYYVHLIVMPLDIDENENQRMLNIYPNPSYSYIKIELSQNMTLTIVDVTGKKLVYRDVQSPRALINVSSLLPGIYFLHFLDDHNNVTIKKMVKL